MRDFKLYYEDGVGFDINIEGDGYVELLPYANQTQDQRAAVGAIIVKGTIPGSLDTGVGWGNLYDKDMTMLDIDNEVKQMVTTVAGGSGQANSQYLPIYSTREDGSVAVRVMRGDV